MKQIKRFVWVIALQLPIYLNAQSDTISKGIQWIERPNWQSVKEKAKQENKYIFIDAYATWCGPCKIMAPAYKQAAAMLEPRVRLAKVNTENEQALGAQYNVRSIPTLIIFKGGREIARQAGAMGAKDIVQWVNSH